MSANDVASDRSLPMIQIIPFLEENASKRLEHCIKIALAARNFPYDTMDDYLLAPREERLRRLMRLPNVGKKSANEFDTLARYWFESKTTSVDGGQLDQAGRSVCSSLLPTLETANARETSMATIADYADSLGLVRLAAFVRTAISEQCLPFETLEQYLALPVEVRLIKLKRIPNMTDEAAGELSEVISDWAGSNCVGFTPESRQCFLEDKSFECESAVNVARDPSLGDRYYSLTPREKDVVDRRFAIGRDERQTLEEIGQEYGVTRERIRQIEISAIKKMRAARISKSWELYIADHRQEIINALFNDQPLVQEPARITGEFALAMTVVSGSAVNFLNQNTQRFDDYYWVKPDFDVIEIQTARNRLAIMVAQRDVLPLSIRECAEVMHESRVVIEAAISALGGYKLYSGWIIKGVASARKKRIVNILNLFHQGQIASPASLWDIKVAYWMNYSLDKCSGRDLLISLQEHPSHFINLRELGWLCLTTVHRSTDGEADPRLLPQDIPKEFYSKPVKTGHGLANCIYEIVEKFGPLRLSDAAVIFQREYPKYSKASMYPVLVCFADFIRLAPGVIGIQAHRRNDQQVASARQILLTERDVDLYIIAKNSTPPRLVYPLWDIEMERQWADWLLQRQDYERLGAFLSVAQIADWRIDKSTRCEWERRRESMDGKADIPQIRRFDERIINISMLMTALAAASIYGSVNWMFLNQALGWRVETSRVAVILAVLIRSGVFCPTRRWTNCHRFTERGKELARTLLSRSFLDEDLPTDVLRSFLLEQLVDEEFDDCWVAPYGRNQLIQQIVDLFPTAVPRTQIRDSDIDDEEAAYDGLMGDVLKNLVEGN